MVTVKRAAFDEREQAVSLLFLHLSQFERTRQTRELLHAADRGEQDLRNLFVALRDGQICGAGLMMPQEDGTVFVWPPSTSLPGAAGKNCVVELLTAIRHAIDTLGGWIGQCLVEVDEREQRDALQTAGFGHLTNLVFLRRLMDEELPSPDPPRLERIPFSRRENFERFVDVIERTYVMTLDCPELNGLRSGSEALESHRAAGEFAPERWNLFSRDGQDVAALLMNAHPEQNTWEIVYVGVVPEARGRGFGREILLQGLRAARDAGAAAVLLALDRRNTPAQRMYDTLGFQSITERAVHFYSPRARPRDE